LGGGQVAKILGIYKEMITLDQMVNFLALRERDGREKIKCHFSSLIGLGLAPYFT